MLSIIQCWKLLCYHGASLKGKQNSLNDILSYSTCLKLTLFQYFNILSFDNFPVVLVLCKMSSPWVLYQHFLIKTRTSCLPRKHSSSLTAALKLFSFFLYDTWRATLLPSPSPAASPAAAAADILLSASNLFWINTRRCRSLGRRCRHHGDPCEADVAATAKAYFTRPTFPPIVLPLSLFACGKCSFI